MALNHGLQVGIEAKVEYHAAFEDMGSFYEQWRRTAVNWLQSGFTEEQVEKRLQSEFDLQWAWADSIATEARVYAWSNLQVPKKIRSCSLKTALRRRQKKLVPL